MSNEPPPMLSGDEGETYVLVPEFSDADINRAAREALEEWCFATDEIPRLAVTKLAKTGLKYRFREHVTVADDCERGGECGPGWWCEFGDGKQEGLYVGFEFAAGENIYLEVSQ